MGAIRQATTVLIAVFMVVGATAVLSVVGRTRPDLSTAVVDGNHDLAQLLLNRGADPGKPIASGLTPIMRAAIRDDAAMVHLLAKAGDDLNSPGPTGAMTPLHMAAIANSPAALSRPLTTRASSVPHGS